MDNTALSADIEFLTRTERGVKIGFSLNDALRKKYAYLFGRDDDLFDDEAGPDSLVAVDLSDNGEAAKKSTTKSFRIQVCALHLSSAYKLNNSDLWLALCGP